MLHISDDGHSRRNIRKGRLFSSSIYKYMIKFIYMYKYLSRDKFIDIDIFQLVLKYDYRGLH